MDDFGIHFKKCPLYQYCKQGMILASFRSLTMHQWTKELFTSEQLANLQNEIQVASAEASGASLGTWPHIQTPQINFVHGVRVKIGLYPKSAQLIIMYDHYPS